MTDADEISTTRTTPWWMPDFAGSVVGLICAVLSVTPSLLPRPAILQGALAAFSFAIGYLLGAMLWAAIRRLLRRGPAPRIRRRWWIAYAAAWVVVIGVLSIVAVAWALMYRVANRRAVRRAARASAVSEPSRIAVEVD